MRVVCDNCGAVYKIADSKLSKDVNKATCKRCGHKIVIYKAGFRPAGDASDDDESEPEERTVIKSVEGLDRIGASSGSMPAIGSLTAELRAISLPGVQPVAPPIPATLGPATGGPLGPPPLPSTPPPIHVPPLAPAPIGIPPKDAPPTAHYGGPRPAVPRAPGVPVAPPAASGRGDKTRPMNKPPGPATAEPALGPAGQGQTTAPPAGRPAPPPSVQTPAVKRPPAKAAAASQASVVVPAAAAAPGGSGDGSAELGVVAGLGAVGLVGVAAAALAPAPLSSAGIALAGFGAAAALFLPILSSRGRKAGQAGIAIFIGLLIGAALGFLAHTRVAELADDSDGLSSSELPPPPKALEPVTPFEPATPPEPATPDDGLSEAEREEARKFSDKEIAGLGSPTPEASTPKPIVREEPTPKPVVKEAATPKPVVKEEPTPAARRPVGPGAPPEETESGGDNPKGPSPFVIDTIIRNNANIQRCFALEKSRDTDISGKIYLKFSIAPDGKVSRARITTSRFAGTALDQCVSKEVNQLVFPPFEGETQQVRYPFNVL